MSSSVRIAPDTLAQHIRNILLRLFSSFLSADGSAVDYAGISRSPLFGQFKLLAVELQRAEVDTMTRTRAADYPLVSQSVSTITEKAPTRAFSWLKAPTSIWLYNLSFFWVTSHVYPELLSRATGLKF